MTPPLTLGCDGHDDDDAALESQVCTDTRSASALSSVRLSQRIDCVCDARFLHAGSFQGQASQRRLAFFVWIVQDVGKPGNPPVLGTG